jgi:hypothetical protein
VTTHLVTFSDESMSRSRILCVGSSVSPGGINDPRSYTPWNINGDDDGLPEVRKLYKTHKSVFDAPRGLGYWAWKPTLIYYYALQFPSMFGIDEGDIVVYADAGVEFIAPVNHIIDRMDQDIFLFGNSWEHAHWCKRDIVDEMIGRCDYGKEFCDYNEHAIWKSFRKQCQASVVFFRVSDYSRQFVAEWLKWCLFEGGRLIDDSPSRAPNHPEFQENRHDQAILTTLAYREGIKLHYWPAVYNRGGSPEFVYEKLPEYAGDNYPILFNHHRKRDHEWSNAACS